MKPFIVTLCRNDMPPIPGKLDGLHDLTCQIGRTSPKYESGHKTFAVPRRFISRRLNIASRTCVAAADVSSFTKTSSGFHAAFPDSCCMFQRRDHSGNLLSGLDGDTNLSSVSSRLPGPDCSATFAKHHEAKYRTLVIGSKW